MSHDSRVAPLFGPIDVTADPSAARALQSNAMNEEVLMLLRQLVHAQEKNNQLLEELITQTAAPQKQRVAELNQWKQANPHLANTCRLAAESLSKVQTSYLESLTMEVNDNADALLDGEFVMNEFVDRFGPRLAHLNGVLQVLSQLSAAPQQNTQS